MDYHTYEHYLPYVKLSICRMQSGANQSWSSGEGAGVFQCRSYLKGQTPHAVKAALSLHTGPGCAKGETYGCFARDLY